MIALITGASRGLGYALAAALAPKYHIIAVARTAGGLEDLDDVIQSKGGSSTLVPLDLTDADGVSRMCLSIHERWGAIDLWAHTASEAPPLSPAHHITAKELGKTINLHVTTTSDLINKVDPLLRPNRGHAIFMRDDHSEEKFFGSYAAAKAAETALFEAWRAESLKSGPKVVGFAPNPMPTATRARFFPGEDRGKLSPCQDEADRLIADYLS
ncbi:MAG: SDR family oxidoreductase [Pseudomonadota bacterium]